MAEPKRIKGAKYVCALPDEGPWRMTMFRGRVIVCSQISGAYTLEDDKLVPVLPLAATPEE